MKSASASKWTRTAARSALCRPADSHGAGALSRLPPTGVCSTRARGDWRRQTSGNTYSHAACRSFRHRRSGSFGGSMAECPRTWIGRWPASTWLTFCASLRWPPRLRPSSSSAIRAVPAATPAACWAGPCAKALACNYVNGKKGVKDFDVWSFYARHGDWPLPGRWRATRDFGPSKFGRYPGDPPRYAGRRADLHGRSLATAAGTDPGHAIHDYLTAGRTKSARRS